MRILIGLTFLIALVMAGYLFFSKDASTSSNDNSIITVELTSLPERYCPQSAQLVLQNLTSGALTADRSIAVSDCTKVTFARLTKSSAGYQAFLKLPKALAVSFKVSDKSVYRLPLRVGDVTGDNVINANDHQMIVSAMYQEGSNIGADVSLDEIVNIEDLSLVALNQGVGIERPDRKPWSTNER